MICFDIRGRYEFHVLLQDALADEEVALRVATVLFDKVMIKLCHGIPRRLLLPLPLPAAGNLNPCETFRKVSQRGFR